jgi:hypothetical protein
MAIQDNLGYFVIITRKNLTNNLPKMGDSKVKRVRGRNVLILTAILGTQTVFILIYFLFWLFSGNWCGRVLPSGQQEIYFGQELCQKLYLNK